MSAIVDIKVVPNFTQNNKIKIPRVLKDDWDACQEADGEIVDAKPLNDTEWATVVFPFDVVSGDAWLGLNSPQNATNIFKVAGLKFLVMWGYPTRVEKIG